MTPAKPDETGVTVIPLLWTRDHINKQWRGHAVPETGPHYLVLDDGRWCKDISYERIWVLDQARDVEGAKAAAQADYEARIRSALSPTKQEDTPVADTEDRAHLRTIDERDAAEDALGEMFTLVTGRQAEWSNMWNYRDALNEVEEALAPSPSVSREAIRAEAFEEAAQWAAAAAVTGVQLGWDASATGDHVVASIRARALSAPEHGERTI